MYVSLKVFFYIVIGIIAFIIFATVANIYFGYAAAKKRFEEGISLESNKNYKEACYAYATTVSYSSRYECRARKRIRELWVSYGPFEYSDIEQIIEELKKELQGDSVTDHSKEDELEEHTDALSFIRQAIETKFEQHM